MGASLYLCRMFVRRKVNKSGSISVHVVDKARGKYRVVKVFGPVESEQEVARLERQARTYIREAGGGVDLFPDEADGSIEDFLSSVSNTQVQVAGPELIFGRLYDRIGYGEIEEEMFRHLVICRLFNPGSKLRTVDYLRRYLGVSYEVGRIYRFLDRLCAKGTDGAEGIKHQVEDISFRHTREVVGGSIKVAFYDMTTLYFEAAEEDSLRIPGFNKDGKHSCPQIFLGLLVAAQGNPIGYEIYEGNIFEGHTLIPMIEGLAARHGFSHPVVVADAGLLSKKNIQALEGQNYQYILGARPKNESDSIKDRIIGLNLKNGDVKVLDKGGGRRLVVSKTERREHKDAANRKRGLERLRKRMGAGRLTKANINNRGYNKYLKMEGDVTISIDMEKYEADAVWDGIKAYVTNTDLTAEEVISSYGNLWYIERAFRMNKTDLQIRPIYHRLRNRIEGHICICFTAYTILLEMERILKEKGSKLTLDRVREAVKTMYRLNFTLPGSGQQSSVLLKMDDEQQEIYDLLYS